MTSVASGATTDEFPVCCSFIVSQLKTLSFTALSNLCFLQIYYLLSISVVLYPSCTVYSWLIKPASPGWGPESCVVWKRLWFCGVPQAWGPLLCLHCGLPFGPPPFSLLSFQPSLPSAPLPSAFSYVHIAWAYAASTGHHFSNGHQGLSWPWLPGRLCPLILTVFSVLVSGADVWTSGIITEGALPPLEMPYVHAVLDNWSVTKCPLCCVSPKSSLTECRRRVCFLWGMWWVEVFRRLLGADYFCYGFSGWRVFTTFWVNSLWDLASVS